MGVTEVQVVEPITPTATLPAPLFLLVQNGNRVLPDSRARSYLFQDGWAIDLGQPSQDRLLARGARPGDRLCVYDLGASRLGCETITAGDTELALVAKPGWQPEITITPVTSVTLAISVEQRADGLVAAGQAVPAGRAVAAGQHHAHRRERRVCGHVPPGRAIAGGRDPGVGQRSRASAARW